jgi:ATP-dependent Clp protease ATP-binding subunit ClpA
MTFVCTANTGHGVKKKHSIGFGTQESREEDELSNVKDALKAQFGEPLLNRIDEIVVFDALGEDDLVEICLISYRKLVDKMHRRYGVCLTDVYPESQLEQEARERFSASSGNMDARTAWNGFEKEIVPKAIELLD